MTEPLFRDDAYLRSCDARVVAILDDAVVLDRTVFYASGGGQPGDTGQLRWDGGTLEVTDTRYLPDGNIGHLFGTDAQVPQIGERVEATIDWQRRYRHMRMHTALHLLGSVLRYGVTGGNISPDKSRLDFDTEDSIDKDAVTTAVNELVNGAHTVSTRWITDAELDAQPELVRTMSVQPPRGRGRIRLLEIAGVDLQPCGGTHVKTTSEIGAVRIGKIEKKGRHNRRVNLHLDD